MLFVFKNQTFIFGTWSTILSFLVGDISKKNASQIILPCSLHDLALKETSVTFGEAYKNIDYCTSDSMFLTWFFSLQHKCGADRIYGPDLMQKILKKEQQVVSVKKHYFLAPNTKTMLALQKIITNQYAGLKATFDYLPKKYEEGELIVLKKIIDERPDFVWLGMGSPKQVEVAVYLKNHLFGARIFCVGAAFEFITKQKKQAPYFLQTSGLEWLFRLVIEPKRLWKRYIITIPKFLLLSFWRTMGSKLEDACKLFFQHMRQKK